MSGPAIDMTEVKVGSLVRWNGRTNPQTVSRVGETWFEVKSHSDSFYRFYPHKGYLVNLQSDTEYDIEEFEILGEVYDVGDW